jgi:hypothetical protein
MTTRNDAPVESREVAGQAPAKNDGVATIDWEPSCDDDWEEVASDDDEGWELRASDRGFEIDWGCVSVSCDANDLAEAKREAGHLFAAVRTWAAAWALRARAARKAAP